MSRLIAFIGPAGAGKSTAADALVEEGWVRAKFADPLKNMMRAYYRSCGLEDSAYVEARIEGNHKEEPDPFLKGRTPRHAMQTLGTQWGRDCIHKNLWVEAWSQKVMNLFDRGLDVVVDDLRFENEEQAVRSLGGRIVEITGRSAGIGTAHASEQYRPKAHIIMYNLGTVEQFQQDIVYTLSRTDYPEPEPFAETP